MSWGGLESYIENIELGQYFRPAEFTRKGLRPSEEYFSRGAAWELFQESLARRDRVAGNIVDYRDHIEIVYVIKRIVDDVRRELGPAGKIGKLYVAWRNLYRRRLRMCPRPSSSVARSIAENEIRPARNFESRGNARLEDRHGRLRRNESRAALAGDENIVFIVEAEFVIYFSESGGRVLILHIRGGVIEPVRHFERTTPKHDGLFDIRRAEFHAGASAIHARLGAIHLRVKTGGLFDKYRIEKNREHDGRHR